MEPEQPSTDRGEEIDRLAERVERLERERRRVDTFRGFASAYAAFAVAFVVVSFLPFYDPDSGHGRYDISWATGSMWEILGEDDAATASDTSNGAAIMGVVLLMGLVCVLALASFGRVTKAVGLPFTIGLTAMAIAALVVAQSTILEIRPETGRGADAAVTLSLLLVAVAAVHAWLLIDERSGSRQEA